MSGRRKRANYLYYACSSMYLPSPGRTCNQDSVRADTLDAAAWNCLAGLLSSDEALDAGIQRMLERLADEMLPRRARLAEIAEQIERATRRIQRWVAEYADATTNEMVTLKARVRDTSHTLDTLRAEQARLSAELTQGAATSAEREALLQSVGELRGLLAEAASDPEAQLYIVDRLGLQCVLRNADDGLWADLSCSVGQTQGAIKSTVPRSALPATPARHCGTRPAPRSPACPSR